MMLLKRLRQYFRRNEGATAIEFALVAIPFLMMIFGVMEVGRIAWIVNGVQYAVEETSRFASLNSGLSTDELLAHTQQKLSDMMISPQSLDIVSSSTIVDGVNFIEIQGSYDVSPMTTNLLFPEGFGIFNMNTTARAPIID